MTIKKCMLFFCLFIDFDVPVLYDDYNEANMKVHGFVVCEFSSLVYILICLVGCKYPCSNCHASTNFITKVIKRE
jgi:hypothetical protein